MHLLCRATHVNGLSSEALKQSTVKPEKHCCISVVTCIKQKPNQQFSYSEN